MVAAQIRETAMLTLRPSGDADSPAVIHEAVAELIALLGRDDFPKSLFYLRRLLDVVCQPDQIAETDAVRVGDDGRLSIYISEDEVRALSPDAGKGQELLHVIGDDVVILFMQNLHAGADVPGLGMPETAGADNRLNFLRGSGGKRGDIREFPKKVPHDDIDPGIGALRGKPHADEKLPGVPVVQGAFGVRIFLFQPFDDGKSQFFFLLKILHCFLFKIYSSVFDVSRLLHSIRFAPPAHGG